MQEIFQINTKMEKFQIYKEYINRFLTIPASDNTSKILDSFF